MMRKLLLLLLVVAVGLWAAHGGLIELRPAVGNAPSEYRLGKTPMNLYTRGSKAIGDANYIIQYDSESWAYYLPRPAEDTNAVWFQPPAKCSLVAFTWIGYNTTTGAVGAPVGVFVTKHNAAANLATYPGVNEYDGTDPTPLGALLWSGTTSAPANMVWDTVDITPGIDVMDSIFFCGYSGVNVLDTIACLGESWVPKPSIINIHNYQYNADGAGGGGGWLCYYYTADNEAVQSGIRAYVKAYENVAPKVVAENLPNSYDTGDRTVSIYGYDFGPDSSAVVVMELYYQVNGGSLTMLSSNTPVSGTIDEGIWEIDIPGVGVGDTVDYYVVGKDWIDAPDTSGPFSYEIKTGDAGDFLYVINDDDPANVLPEYWLSPIDTCDVWDVVVEGNFPDSSVIAFYNTIVWRDWGGFALGPGANYGIGGYGVRHSDSAYIKTLLDNGGNFWYSDQDMGYGLGICPNYGQQAVPTGHWIRDYLGIHGMYDDGPLGGAPVTVFGNPADPIIGDMFAGIGYQAAGMVYIQPDQMWVGNFDSLNATAVTNMFTAGGEIVSYRFEGGAVHNGKVFVDFYPFDYIKNPADTSQFDRVAVDSLVVDVLGWFGYPSGVGDRTIEPEKVAKLLHVGLITNEASIRFSLPGRMTVSLDIYDNTGRLVKNLVNGERDGGLHTVRWNANVANGVYFYLLKAGNETLSNKMVVVK